MPNELLKCKDVILKSYDRIDVILENDLTIEVFSNFPDIFDINDFIGKTFEVYKFNKTYQLWNMYYHDIICFMSNDKNIWLSRGEKGDIEIDNLNMFNDWIKDDRKQTILNYFEVSELKEISRDNLLNFIETIEDRCECCGNILNDDDWDNYCGSYFQPPECNGYHCSNCGETVKF